MAFKKTPVGSQQNNTNDKLQEMKADLEKALNNWESFLDGIEVALFDDELHDVGKEISTPLESLMEKIKQMISSRHYSSKVDNTNVLTEIRDDLKRSLEAWEGFLNVVEPGLMDEDWVIAENVSGPIVKSVKKIDQALRTNVPVKKSIRGQIEWIKANPGDNSTTSSEVCSVCRLLVDRESVDWEFMKETNTWQVVCKDCAEIFENHKGDK